MARPMKNTVDYFPHVAQTGKTIAILEARWGNDGYAFWFKTLELLGSLEGFSYDCNKLCLGENPEADRAHFLKIYESMRQRNQAARENEIVLQLSRAGDVVKMLAAKLIAK